MDYTKPIPTIGFPSIHDYTIANSLYKTEPLVSMKEEGFIVDSQYYNRGIPGAYKDVYLRQTPAMLLKEAEKLLPKDYRFKLYDGYRPLCVQQRLWNFYRRTVINENKDKNLSKEEIDKMTSFFVSFPSGDIQKPFLHNTGGSIDLTIVDANGQELDMGSSFDEFGHKCWSNHFEDDYPEHETNINVRDNRRLLYNVMIEAGFTNLPSEWWHYDFGTKFWMYFTGNKEALYAGIPDVDFPNRFPLR